MPAIDMHTHAFPDELAGRAIAALEAGCPWKAVGDGTVAAMLASMDRCGVDVSVVCTIATKPGQASGILNWCKSIRSERIVPLPSVHPRTPDAARWIEKFAKEGFAGIKLHPMYQSFAADDPQIDAIYAACRETGLLVASHCGLDIGYPPDDDRAAPVRYRRAIDRFAGLKLVCTHMGGWRSWEESARHIVGQDVYLETSFSLEDLGPERSAELIERHGCDRVLFGTDWPWADQTKELASLRKLPLKEPQLSAILYDNAARLLGL